MLRNKLTKYVQDISEKNYETDERYQRRTTNGDTFYMHGPEDSVLPRFQDFLTRSADSVQSEPKPQRVT